MINVFNSPDGEIIDVKKKSDVGTIVPGSVVSYKYNLISPSGLPVLPVIYRIRYDLTWADVMPAHHSERRRSVQGIFLSFSCFLYSFSL
jgi:hypothetical protein